jgi:hypothetical protein
MAEFNDDRRAKFIESIARAVGDRLYEFGPPIGPIDVTIDNVEAISSARRSLLASSIRIDVTVKAQMPQEAADSKEQWFRCLNLTQGNIIAETAKAGFPGAQSLGPTESMCNNLKLPCREDLGYWYCCTSAMSRGAGTSATSRGAEGGMSPFPIIGGAVGGVVLIGIAVAYWWCRRQRNTSGPQSAVPRPSESAFMTVSAPAMPSQPSALPRPCRPPSAPPPASPRSLPPTPLPAPSAASRAAPLTRRGSQSQPGNMMVGNVYDPSLSELRAWQQQPVIARTIQTPVHISDAGMGKDQSTAALQAPAHSRTAGMDTDRSTASLHAQEQIIAQPHDDNEKEVPLVHDISPANQHAQQACFETRCFQQQEERVRDRMTTGPPLHPAPPSSTTPPQPPEAPWKRECVVCYDKEPTMAMIPCFHVCACEDCFRFLRECPMCRAPVFEARRIYLI